MEFAVLGPVRVARDGLGSVLSGRLQRTLLAVLLAHANRTVPSDTLTDVLWPDVSDRRADPNLRLHVHRLRRTLGEADRLTFESSGYRLTVMPGELDAERFESLVDEAAQVAESEPGRCVELVRKALGLWRGQPYEAMDVALLADAAQRLSDLRVAAIEQLYEAELACGRDAALVGELSDLVRRHPLRERLHALLMTALYRAGRQADALRVYQDARRVLVDELGLEPGPELRAIEQQVLAGEPVDLGGTRAAGPARVAPAQLPANVRGFVGREEQLADLDRAATEAGGSTGIVTLLGTAGVGKTALAVRWAHRIRDRYPDGQLYVDLHGYGPSAPVAADDALAGFLRSLGVEGAAIPQALEERAARFRSLVDGRRMLVVLDNARTVDQVRPLLPGSESCFVLVTSRDALAGIGVREGARRINVDRLPVDESRQLMRQLLGDQAPDDAVLDGLIDRCVRLPLAMRIAVDLVNLRPARGVPGLVSELAEERDRLDLLEVEDDPHSAVRAVFSWSYRQLPSETAGLFRACGMHPGPDIDAYALAALAGRDRRDTQRSLDRLIRAHLIDERSEGRYQMHDLLRAYARELVVEAGPGDARVEAIERLAAFYLAGVAAAMDHLAPYESKDRSEMTTTAEIPRLSTHEEARAWLDRERPNLLALVPEADDFYPTALSTMLFRYFELGGMYDDALSVHTQALASARRLGDVPAEIKAHRNLGSTYYALGRYEESVGHDRHAIELCRMIGDRRAEAVTVGNQGATERMRGRYQEALTLYHRAMELRSEDDRTFALVLASNTGSLHLEMGEPEKAVGYLEPALTIAEELNHRAAQVTIRCILAESHAVLGADDEALAMAQRASGIARDVASIALEADVLNTLGRVHELHGDHERALAYYERGLETAQHAGHAVPHVEALLGLGRTHRLLGSAARALRRFEEAADLVTAHGQRHQLAHTHAGIGAAYADLGEPDRAREHWSCALDLHRELGLPEAEQVQAKLDVLDE